MQPTRKPVWRLLKRLKIELPYDPAVPLLGTDPEISIPYCGDICTSMIIATRIMRARKWKQPSCPSTEK